MPHSAVSDLDLHSSSMSHKKDTRLTWVNEIVQLYGLRREKTCLWGFANKTDADPPAHPHSLISPFVVHFLENIICKLATGEISIF